MSSFAQAREANKNCNVRANCCGKNNKRRRITEASMRGKFSLLALFAGLVLLALVSLAATTNSYQFPIQQYPFERQKYQHRRFSQQPQAFNAAQRRADQEQAPADENEAQQLRQLHQVVDTMAQLLNEEEQQQQRRQQRPAHEMLSESDIRYALEELERVQQEERRNSMASAESRLKPAILAPNQDMPVAAALHSGSASKQLESFADELGDAMLDDQLVSASQEALLQAQDVPREKAEQRVAQLASTVSSATSPAPSSITPASVTAKSVLLTGQLDTQSSELNSALTNDFYSFHETNAEARPKPSQSGGAISSPVQDLEQAAQQPRSSVVTNSEESAFSGQAPNAFNGFNQPQVPPQQARNQENLVRAFRQQTGASGLEDQQLNPSSTLLPSPDNFWRPTINNNEPDINQQYNRARSTNPALPQPRFQSIAPAPFAPNQPNNRAAQFSNNPFSSGDIGGQFAGRDNRPFSSTAAPLISVLSGSDTSSGIGNSVSWNPPPTINLPAPSPANQFNQQFLPQAPTQVSSPPPQELFFPPSNQQRSAPQQPAFRPILQNSPPQEGSPSPIPIRVSSEQNFGPKEDLSSSTEANSLFDSTTSSIEDRFQQPTTTQWSPAASLAPVEREVSDSRPRSSFRPLPNNQRFFSPNDLLDKPVSSTPFSEQNAPRAQQVATTTSNPITTTMAATNSSKKEDMVIYYYYYYDDNKNATVVAKNISGSAGAATSPMPLDAAIEADSGIEDTPYMDDPAPMMNQRTPATSSSVRTSPISSTTLTPATRFESTTSSSFREEAPRSRFQTESSHTSTPSRSSQFEPSSHSFSSVPSHQLENQPRASSADRNKVGANSQQSHRQQFQEAPLTPAPSNVPSSTPALRTTSARTQAQHSSFHHQDHKATNTRTEHSLNQQQAFASTTTPSSRILSNNMQPPTQADRQQASSGSNNRAAHLSNASRYGTNNNLLIDQYGLDPSVPGTFGHSSSNEGAGHQKNWQSSGAASQSASHQFSRTKAAPVVPSSTPGAEFSFDPSVEPQQAPKNQIGSSSRTANNQHFAAQRNNNPVPPNKLQPSQVQPSTTRSQQPNAPISPNNNRQQFFPEAETARQVEPTRTNVPPRGSSQATNNDFTLNRIEPNNRETLRVTGEQAITRLSSAALNNGRPSTPEGNTSNGFTRAPLQVSSPTTQAPVSSSTTRLNSADRGSAPSSTQSTVSTSVTRTFVTPQQVQVTTSISPPTISSTTESQTSTAANNITPPTTTTTTTTSATSSSSVSSITESSSPSTEANESGAASTRRKFGNRNSRFQTRLSSIGANSRSSTTTTSTTASPAITSTTRRPVVSTTRRTPNKQLFAGRRRLGNQTNQDASPASNSSLSRVTISTSTAFSVTESSSSSPVSTSRARFGNSFTARTRSTTSAPASNAQESSSTQKPSNLFGAQQRSTMKPRLSFQKTNKPAAAADISGPASEIPKETVTDTIGPAEPTVSVSEKSANNSETLANTEPTSPESEPMRQDNSNDKNQMSSTTIASAPVPEQTTTTSAPITSTPAAETSSRNKPKVRPLFASRQRSSSLFGNRRNNNATVTS